MSAADLFSGSLLWSLPVTELFEEDDLKRIPPLFFDEDADIENLLLVHKLVARHDPCLEVYLYEHENGIFSALFVDRQATELFFSLTFLTLKASDSPRRFEHIRGFKPRTIGELFNQAENLGQRVIAEEHSKMVAGFSEEAPPSA